MTPRIELLAAHGSISLPVHPLTQPFTLYPASLKGPQRSTTACLTAVTRPLHELRFNNVPVWKPGTTGQRFPVFWLRLLLPPPAVYTGDGWDGFTNGPIFRRQHGGLGEMLSADLGDGKTSCVVSLFAVIPWRAGPLTFQVSFPYHLPGHAERVLGPLTVTVNVS